MKVVDFLIYCLKVLWKYTDKVLGVLFYYFGYRRVRITFYGAFLCCGFLLQSYDTGDTHLHTSVTKYDATINLYKILTPILLLRLSVQELFGKDKEQMTVAEIFDKTPPTEKFIGDCGVHDRKGGYGEIPDCLPTEQFTVKKFLDKDLLGYAIQLTDSDTPFQGHEVYGGGIPPYLWQFDFGKNVTDFLEAATAANSVKVYVHLFPSYVTSFGQGVTEPYGMTALSWDGYNNVLVNGKFSISYKLRHITRLEWPMDSDCRDYPGSSRGKCMNDFNHSAMKKMRREGKLNGTLPLNFRLFEHDAMFQDLKLALNKDYKTNETNAILKEVYEECGHQCQRRECAETLIEPTVVAATRDQHPGVRLYAPNKPKIFIREEEVMTFGQMVVGVLSIASFWFPEIHVLKVLEDNWPILLASATVMATALFEGLVSWFTRRSSTRRVHPFADGNVIFLRENAVYFHVEPDTNGVLSVSIDSELSDIDD